MNPEQAGQKGDFKKCIRINRSKKAVFVCKIMHIFTVSVNDKKKGPSKMYNMLLVCKT